jgi:hypothetical protein
MNIIYDMNWVYIFMFAVLLVILFVIITDDDE